MSLQFIIGNSGAGKSHMLYEKIIAHSIKFPQKKYYVLVPEQFTMQTQKDLVMLHPGKGILNIDVLSFPRLAYRVFEEVGADNRQVLEELGKTLVLRKVAQEQKKNLQMLGGSLHKTGYITQVKSMISELAQYNVTPSQLAELAAGADHKPQLQFKLKDISVLYQGYQDYLKDKYITSEELLTVLCDVVDRSGDLRDSVIAVDGFTGFTPIQNQLVEKLLGCAAQVIVTVTMDVRETYQRVGSEHGLFYLSQKTVRSVTEMARNQRVEVMDPILLGKEQLPRFRQAPALEFLERRLFRYGSGTYDGEQDEIQVHLTKNPLLEARYLGKMIRQLVREEGFRYKDIAVIAGDLSAYAPSLERELAIYQVPYFMDSTHSILLNPMIESVRALLEVVSSNYTYKSVFRLLRCNLMGMAREDVDLLENYVIALGIRGYNRWKSQWVRLYRGMDEEMLLRVNEIRADFMEKMEAFTDAVKQRKATVRDYAGALYQLMESCRMQQQIKAMELEFKLRREQALEKEYAQIFAMIMDLLDKVVDLLGEERIGLKEFADILDAGFEEVKVGIIPPGVDQVMIGDMERTRLKDIKVLFLLGANDGIIPKISDSGALLNDFDREELQKQELELAPTARQNSYIQKFYLYLNLTKPSQRLYISYSKMGSGGGALSPSYLISSLQRLYPRLQVRDEDLLVDTLDYVATFESGISYLAEGLSSWREELPGTLKELFHFYYQDEKRRGQAMKLVDAAFYSYTSRRLPKEVAALLYGTILENSVSRLERFASCAFAHFLDYGLHVSERQEYSFAAVDMGNIFHKVLEEFTKTLDKSPFDWFNLSEDVQAQMVEACIEQAASDYGNTILESSSRNAYIVERMRRIMNRTVWALKKQIQRGSFLPESYEVSFAVADDLDSINVALSDQEKMRLKGRIDRLDLLQEEDRVYVKVVDYKSGNTSFDLLALYHGLQLQLVVYMNAAVELQKKRNPGKEVIPAGILYYNIKDPVVDKAGAVNEEEIRGRILEELKMNGLVQADLEVLKKMDKDLESDVHTLPVKIKKGTLQRGSSVATQEQFEALGDFTREKIRRLGQEILDGEIGVEPYLLGNDRGCTFCDYQSICGFDRRIPGFRYRKLEKMTKDEVWNAFKRSAEAEDQVGGTLNANKKEGRENG